MTALLIALGAAVGAPLRYLTDRAVQNRHDQVFPWGTFTVNVIGSFILGLATAAAARGTIDPGFLALIGIGFCGALTTFSTFGYETLRLVEEHAWFDAAMNVCGSVTAGLLAAGTGWALGNLG